MNEIIANEGFWLTQSTVENEENRIFVKKVAGFGNLNQIYAQWTDEQKQQWEAEHPVEEPEI